MSSAEKKHIFISYQRDNQATVQTLVQVLEKTGNYTVWYDLKLQGGQIWWDEIIRHIQAADIVILALSPTYLTSKPCELERDYANALSKAIIPIQIDATLQYSSLPLDVSKLQIRKYFGQANEFQILEDDLKALSSPALPANLPPAPEAPKPPPAPTPPPKPGESRRNSFFGGLGAFALVVLALTAYFAPKTNPNAESPRATDTSPADNPTEAEGELGNFDLRLQYGEQNSFTIIVSADSNLWGIRLKSSIIENEISLTERFPDLETLDYQLAAGACLRFEREGTSPVVPLACNSEQILRVALSPAEVFWFDASSNLYANVTLIHGDSAPQLCPHDNGSGDCQIRFEG